MSNEPLTRNITRTFRQATDGDRAIGYGWYGRARELGERLAFENDDSTGYEERVRCAAGVIAAISPRLAWRKNVEYAERAYILDGELKSNPDREDAEYRFAAMLPVLNANGHKAFKILNGQAPEDVLGGDKVRSFYFTIIDPTDPRSVVVDRHAIDIAFGEVLNDATRPTMKGAAYRYVADLYRNAAKIVSRELDEIWTPAQVQAATWTYWRRERAAAYHGEA